MNTSFSVRASTIGRIIQADNMTALQKRLGLSALIDLAEDAISVKIIHGSAVALAAVLKDGGLNSARSKYYSEKACQLAGTIQHRAMLNSAKVRGDATKAEARKISQTADFAELASMASISAAQLWAKKNGPKAEKAKASDNGADDNGTDNNDADDNNADDNQPSHEAIEQAGQLREIREIITMVMTGQLEDYDAISAIAEALGMKRGETLADLALTKRLDAAIAKGKASTLKAA